MAAIDAPLVFHGGSIAVTTQDALTVAGQADLDVSSPVASFITVIYSVTIVIYVAGNRINRSITTVTPVIVISLLALPTTTPRILRRNVGAVGESRAQQKRACQP